MFAVKTGSIHTHKEFKSAFVTPLQRRNFLLECAHKGFEAIYEAWPDDNVKFFVFGSAARLPVNIGADSDLDIAVSGLDHIAPKSWQRNAMLLEIFKSGLSCENKTLPVDVVTFDHGDPQTTLAREIVENGIEIKLE